MTGLRISPSSSAAAFASCRSPRFLNYLPGSESRYVLLQTSEYENWPDHAPPISLVARFHDQSGGERILARTAGLIPVPGQNTPRYLP